MFDQAITAAFQIMVFVFFYVALNMNKNHAPMQILFMAMGFVFQIVNLDIMRQIAVDAGKTGIASTIGYAYNGLIYVMILVLFYFIILFMYEVFVRFKAPEDVL